MKINKSLESYTISAVKYVGLTITRIYYGTKLIWSYIKSCFGSGKWIDSAPWSDIETWKNE